MAAVLPKPRKYSLPFDDKQWEEIVAVSFTGFEIESDEPMWRDQWVAVGHIMLGKAARLRTGACGADGDRPDDGDEEWAAELEEIADAIFEEFQAGDMKL